MQKVHLWFFCLEEFCRLGNAAPSTLWVWISLGEFEFLFYPLLNKMFYFPSPEELMFSAPLHWPRPRVFSLLAVKTAVDLCDATLKPAVESLWVCHIFFLNCIAVGRWEGLVPEDSEGICVQLYESVFYYWWWGMH